MANNRIYQPNFTQIPNIILDYWMGILTPAEFKVLLCICRKTFGWQKARDRISLRQIEKMTGLGKSSIVKNVENLIEHGLVIKLKFKDEFDGSDAPNQYEINVVEVMDECDKNDGGSPFSGHPPVHSVDTPRVHSVDTQKKDLTKETIQNKISLYDSKSAKASKEIPSSLKKVKEIKQLPKDSIEYQLALELLKAIKKTNPDFKDPNLDKWASSIDLIIRVDKRDAKLVYQLITKLPLDDFWNRLILSPDALRKQFDKFNAAQRPFKQKTASRARLDENGKSQYEGLF